jgi:hypothetical protein
MDPNSHTRTNHHPQPQVARLEPRPVAYDQNGRPLYASPEDAQAAANGGNYVYLAKPINPIEQPISPEIQAKTEESRKKFPQLNLSPGEYVLSAVTRHPIGLLRIWFIALVLVVAFMALYAAFFVGGGSQDLFSDTSLLRSLGAVGLGILTLLVASGAMVATYVYNANRFYLTNESVVQEIQTSLFSRREQTVSLANIEDASYHQNGIFPSLFNYGTIRLSTEGDETTYRFSYVSNPKKQIAVLNNAVEAFKNGRPVDTYHQDQPS